MAEGVDELGKEVEHLKVEEGVNGEAVSNGTAAEAVKGKVQTSDVQKEDEDVAESGGGKLEEEEEDGWDKVSDTDQNAEPPVSRVNFDLESNQLHKVEGTGRTENDRPAKTADDSAVPPSPAPQKDTVDSPKVAPLKRTQSERTPASGSGGRYLPPHLRNKEAGGATDEGDMVRRKSAPLRSLTALIDNQEGAGVQRQNSLNRRGSDSSRAFGGTRRAGFGEKRREWKDHGDQPISRQNMNPFDRRHADADVPETQTGINFERYNDIPVEMSGRDCPSAIEDFDSSNLHGRVLKNISLAKYTSPTPVQKNAIPIIQAARDLMACAQTGSGKTAAFLVPTIHLMMGIGGPPVPDYPPSSYSSKRLYYPTVLIIAPTRELAVQIHEEACKFTYNTGIIPAVVYGGSDFRDQVRQLDRGCDILVATPGRLVDFLQRGKISLEYVKFLILDEADRMLDMGFEPQIRQIVEDFKMPFGTDRQTLLFSATFPKEIQRLASDFLHDYIFLTVGRVGSTTEFIVQRVEYAPDNDMQKRELVIELLNEVQGLTLVFVETKRGADLLEDFLCHRRYPATSIHGDRSQPERTEALRSFRTGLTPILVATDVAARGLDIPNVAHVINYDMPNDINDYVHRIGRTGRAGNNGLATAIVTDSKANTARDLVDLLAEAGQEVPQFLEGMARMSGRSSGKKRGGGNRWGGRDVRRSDNYGDGGGNYGGFRGRASNPENSGW